MKIYIVEDDDNIREMVSYAVKTAGFEAVGFSSGKELFKALAFDGEYITKQKNSCDMPAGAPRPDLVLLDIMLPDEDGITILKKLRDDKNTAKLPVIMLTAKGSELDKVTGFDSGADDYISKPFSVMEMLSRIKAVLRRTKTEEKDENITLEELVILPEKRIVTANGKEISLTFKEFELLLFLARNKGLVLSRDKILTEIWGYDYDGENRTVDMHIKTLRKKLGDSGNHIITIRNVGYKADGGHSVN
ncbi:MAG: response regulator transcription factor [Ruminococcus sp.]|jgi:two-component system alkaline phosphatase synthesis response regulator PhoP|nr:response regulator transcription factor [Ruminococcus sp.]